MGDLRVHGLTVSYQRRPVLRGVGLEAAAGAVTGVIGPNGAGKSTLLKACVGLLPVDRGSVTVGGEAAHRLRHRIAYLPQRSEVDWEYPAQVRDVVAMGRYPHRRRLRRLGRTDREAVAGALARVGLEAFASRPIGELSGGQQQRVFLARALAQQATVMLLDEPLAGVDALTISLLCDVLREVAAEGVTVVVVNHDLRMLPALCDWLVLLSRRIMAAGPVEDVLTGGALTAAYGLAAPASGKDPAERLR